MWPHHAHYSEPFEVETITTTEYQVGPNRAQAEPELDGTTTSPPRVHDCTPSPLPPTPPPVEHMTPPSGEPNLKNNHDEDTLLRFQRMDIVLAPVVVPNLAEHMLQEELHMVSTQEPTSLKEAMGHPSSHTAMVEDLCSIEENCTWDINDLLVGHRPIGLKWVYKVKKDKGGVSSSIKLALSQKGSCRDKVSTSRRCPHLWQEWS
jgi:hypothetical protein